MRVVGLSDGELAAAARAEPPALAVFTSDAQPGSGKPSVLGEVRLESGALVFAPRFPFVPGLGYRAHFRLQGRPELWLTFDVPAPAGEPPRVAGVFPSDEELPANALRLYVHYSQPMEARDAARHVRLIDARGREVALPFVEVEPGLWDPRQTRLTLLFHPGRTKRGVAPGERLGPPLRQGGAYRLRVDAGLRSARGQPLAAPFEKRIRVGPADRVSPRIEDLRVTAPDAPSAPLVVRLPEPLDEALLGRLLWVADASGARVEGVVAIDSGETRWRFRPARPWAPGAYAVRVHPAVEDRAGNRFDRLFDRDVATTPPPDAVEPYRIAFRAAFAER